MNALATLFNNHMHPYISSSKFSTDWRATATYVGMVVECGCVMEPTYHCVAFLFLCALSASAFIVSFLHQLDFFSEISLWRLISVIF